MFLTPTNSDNQKNSVSNMGVGCGVDKTAKKPKKRAFTPQEDQMILALLKQSEGMSWKEIAQYIPGKTTRQCRERYQTYLAPGINQSPWTKEEDEKLVQKYNELGSKWSMIAKFFDGRSANALKNRFNVHIMHKSRGRRRVKKEQEESNTAENTTENDEQHEITSSNEAQETNIFEIPILRQIQKVRIQYPSIQELLHISGINDNVHMNNFNLNFLNLS